MKELISIRNRDTFFNRRKMNQFYYTYAYLREDRTPYYIGKGKGDRIHSTNRTYKPPKDKSRIIFLKQNLTEEEAFKHEKYMIAVFGRKDLGSGILYNRTDGGEGGSNQGTPEQRSESAKKANASRTPEQRSEAIRKVWANKTPEQRSEIAKKANASRTPEQRSEIAKKANASRTPEQRSEISKKAQASKTPEQRSETARKRSANKTPEQRRESGIKSQAGRTPEQRSEAIRKGHASKTPEQKSKGGKKSTSQRWQCTQTGHITNACALSRYQRARGIDTSNRIRIS